VLDSEPLDSERRDWRERERGFRGEAGREAVGDAGRERDVRTLERGTGAEQAGELWLLLPHLKQRPSLILFCRSLEPAGAYPWLTASRSMASGSFRAAAAYVLGWWVDGWYCFLGKYRRSLS